MPKVDFVPATISSSVWYSTPAGLPHTATGESWIEGAAPLAGETAGRDEGYPPPARRLRCLRPPAVIGLAVQLAVLALQHEVDPVGLLPAGRGEGTRRGLVQRQAARVCTAVPGRECEGCSKADWGVRRSAQSLSAHTARR